MLFDNSLSKYFIFKRTSCMQWLFCNASKIKKGYGTSFWCIFSAWCSKKNVPYLIFYQWTEFQCHIFFPSQDIKQNVLLRSYDEVINFKIFPGSTSNAVADGTKNRERRKYKNLNISRTKRAFQMKQKTFFIVIDGLSFAEK